MSEKIKPIPEGYRVVTPYLVVKDAAKYLNFLKNAFGAEERFRMPGPDGSIVHAEVMIGDSVIMLGEARQGCADPTTASFYLYVPDADKSYQRALDAGTASVMEPANQFYGDRSAAVKDYSGNQWTVATHIEDLSPEEIHRRGQEFMKQHQAAA